MVWFEHLAADPLVKFCGMGSIRDTVHVEPLSPVTGLKLLPKAKALRPEVPIIMITAYGDDETKRRALEGGAETLLAKPIDFVALRSEIDTRVERAV